MLYISHRLYIGLNWHIIILLYSIMSIKTTRAIFIGLLKNDCGNYASKKVSDKHSCIKKNIAKLEKAGIATQIDNYKTTRDVPMKVVMILKYLNDATPFNTPGKRVSPRPISQKLLNMALNNVSKAKKTKRQNYHKNTGTARRKEDARLKAEASSNNEFVMVSANNVSGYKKSSSRSQSPPKSRSQSRSRARKPKQSHTNVVYNSFQRRLNALR